MKQFINALLFSGLGAVLMASSCKKEDYTFAKIDADASLSLRDAASFEIGIGADYDSIMKNSTYTATVKAEFDNITPGNEMKHFSVVRNDGSYDFTKADNLVSFAESAGLGVYGHTLVWHQNVNGNYLRALIARPGSVPGQNPDILLNGGFESGSGNNFNNWQVWNLSGTNTVTAGTGGAEVYEGARSLKATITVNGDEWTPQIPSDNFTTVSGTSYRVTFWARAGAAGGQFRISTGGGTSQYSPNFAITTGWQKFEWDFPATAAETRIFFDVGKVANTYYIDKVSVTLTNPVGAPPSAAELKTRVDTTLKSWITAMVGRYKGKVKAWDVINEPLDDNGVLRTGESAGDIFYWGRYLGDSLYIKAFKYAHDADPSAKLFLNDYNHELGGVKLDSLVALITRLKGLGVPIDGVGLQFHMNYNISTANIDNALIKMAGLGLLVKISELDVSVNTGSATDPATKNFVLTPVLLEQQAAKYKHVVESYIRIVPEARRYGITIWGLTDGDSWLRNRLPYHTVDYPLLWDENFGKKPAYTSFQEALQLK